MTIYALESFANASALSDLTVRGWAFTGMAYSSSLGRRNGGCLRHTTTGVTTGHYADYNPRVTYTQNENFAFSSASIGFAFKFGGSAPNTANTYPLLMLMNSGGTEVGNLILYYTGGNWTLGWRTATTVRVTGTIGASFTHDTWHHIELRISSFATTAGSAGRTKIYFNETLIAADAGGAANASTGTTWSTIRMNSYNTTCGNLASGQSMEYCDWWVGTVNATRYPNNIGDCRVDCFLPVADGANNDFTASAGNRYECVDDSGLHDGDSSYVQGNVLNSKQDFKISMTHNPVTIHAAKHLCITKMPDDGTRSVISMITSGASEQLEFPVQQNTMLDSTYRRVQMNNYGDDDPATAAQWTRNALNAASFGLKIVI